MPTRQDKLSTTESLHKQLDIVRIHEWVSGEPEQFMQACLIIRNDAKEEIFDLCAIQEMMQEQDAPYDLEHQKTAKPNPKLNVWWAEVKEHGDGEFGWHFFKPAPWVQVGDEANRLIYLARWTLNYLSQNELDMRIDHDAGEPWPRISKVDAEQYNIEWNDEVGNREEVIKVLQLALEWSQWQDATGEKVLPGT